MFLEGSSISYLFKSLLERAAAKTKKMLQTKYSETPPIKIQLVSEKRIFERGN